MAKTWFITGTSTGFGRELTEQLLAKGDRVAATVRTPDVLASLQSKYGDSLRVYRLDLTNVAEIHTVVDAAFADFGSIDVVVNNAAYGLYGAGEEVSDEQIRHQVDTNLLGSIHVIRAALPHLRAQGGGRVLQISSAGGQTTYPNFSLYHATKWGIEGFVEAVAQEVVPFGVDFTIVEPGASRTSFGTGLVTPTNPMPIYEATPAGQTRRDIASGKFSVDGDPVKMVRAMIASVEQKPAPRRLALGSDTYRDVHRALATRLAELEGQRELAHAMSV